MQKAIHGITVSHFHETYREKLRMDLVTGEAGLHRLIREGSINRPALALTGFFKYFANKRIQVLGAAEMTYLKTRDPADQVAIFQRAHGFGAVPQDPDPDHIDPADGRDDLASQSHGAAGMGRAAE